MSIQYLRAVAALMVVFHHVRKPTAWLWNPFPETGYGRAGVDIFFVISGFIMFIAAREEPAVEFLRRRAIRVVPLYWIVTLALGVLVLLRGQAVQYGLSTSHLFQSMFFIPHYSPSHAGKVWPLLVPGWTLTYEMFFYLLFAIGLAVRRPVIVTGTIIVTLVLVGVVLRPPGAIASIYTNPILLEFLSGILLAAATARWGLKRLGWLLPAGFILLLLLEFFALPLELFRLVGATAIVAGAVSIESMGRLPAIPAMKLLGDASYSIYLVHFNLLNPIRSVFARFALDGPIQFIAFAVVAIAASMIAGIAVYRFVERPMQRLLRGRRTPPAVAGAE